MSACYTAHTKYTILYIRTLSTKKQLVVSCIFVICFTATKLSSQKIPRHNPVLFQSESGFRIGTDKF